MLKVGDWGQGIRGTGYEIQDTGTGCWLRGTGYGVGGTFYRVTGYRVLDGALCTGFWVGGRDGGGQALFPKKNLK